MLLAGNYPGILVDGDCHLPLAIAQRAVEPRHLPCDSEQQGQRVLGVCVLRS